MLCWAKFGGLVEAAGKWLVCKAADCALFRGDICLWFLRPWRNADLLCCEELGWAFEANTRCAAVLGEVFETAMAKFAMLGWVWEAVGSTQCEAKFGIVESGWRRPRFAARSWKRRRSSPTPEAARPAHPLHGGTRCMRSGTRAPIHGAKLSRCPRRQTPPIARQIPQPLMHVVWVS